MATLTVQKPTLTGAVATYAAAGAGGDEFSNTGREFFLVKNASGGNLTVTVNSQANCDQGFDHDLIIVVATATEVSIGPFPTVRFNDGGGKVQVTYSGVTSLTVRAVANL